MSVILHGDQSSVRCHLRLPAHADWTSLLRQVRRRCRASSGSSSYTPLYCTAGMAAQPPSSDRNDGFLGALSMQVDALCGAYTEKMKQLHSMLDREEDSRERTARQMAAGRALWNHVIQDPLARFLAGESHLRKLQGRMEAACGNKEMAGVMMAVRTLWFDGKIEEALQQWRSQNTSTSSEEQLQPQVILLGAGMDTRAYRLKCLEGCAVFEVDLPKIVDFKSALLKCAVAMASDDHRAQDELEKEPSPDPQQEIPDKELAPQLYASSLERVAADLATDEWWEKLISAGFKVGGADDRGSPAPPTIWVLEGLLYYLKEEEAMALLRRISTNCAPGTLVFADFMNEFSTHLSNELQTQFYFHSDWPEELLPTLGYARVRVSQMGDPDANFGLIHDSPLSLFHRLRQIPRYCKLAPDGSPCRRLFLVQFSVA